MGDRMTSISRLIKIYNMILIPIVIVLFSLLYVSIKANIKYAMYSIIVFIILSPFIAYFITKKLAHI